MLYVVSRATSAVTQGVIGGWRLYSVLGAERHLYILVSYYVFSMRGLQPSCWLQRLKGGDYQTHFTHCTRNSATASLELVTIPPHTIGDPLPRCRSPHTSRWRACLIEPEYRPQGRSEDNYRLVGCEWHVLECLQRSGARTWFPLHRKTKPEARTESTSRNPHLVHLWLGSWRCLSFSSYFIPLWFGLAV